MDISQKSQERVQILLQSYTMNVAKFKKDELRNGKTPDFRVYKDNQFAFYCEVKCAQEDAWLDEHILQTAPSDVVGIGRSDPTFNRLTSHIHNAVKQFDEVNPNLDHPNVLAFVNFDWGSDCYDLIAVLSGQFISEDGDNFPIYLQYSEGRIRNEKYLIHLYLRIDALRPGTQVYSLNGPRQDRPIIVIFNIFEALHLDNLCRYFNIYKPEALHGSHWFKRPLYKNIIKVNSIYNDI